MKPTRPFPERARARRRALQALYQWQIGGGPMRRIIEQFNEEQDMAIVDGGYFVDLLNGVETHLEALDAALAPCLDRRLDEVDVIERATLRLAAFELLHRLDIPYRVVINEAVELAKDFGAEGGHSYVNGVLDRLARNTRSAEVRSH
ncbi:MAG: transcription antitermination factor NusB [Lysobacterales bacterium]